MNAQWHGYAAAAAAAYARQLSFHMSIDEVKQYVLYQIFNPIYDFANHMYSCDVVHSVSLECNQINFDQIFNSVSDVNNRYGITVAQLGDRPERSERATCYICHFFLP
jgi:hypothetical protein